jgi:hypothetical protein
MCSTFMSKMYNNDIDREGGGAHRKIKKFFEFFESYISSYVW